MLELELPTVFPAADAALAPVTREFPVCDSALAAADFAALPALELRSVLLAAEAALGLVWRVLPAAMADPPFDRGESGRDLMAMLYPERGLTVVLTLDARSLARPGIRYSRARHVDEPGRTTEATPALVDEGRGGDDADHEVVTLELVELSRA